MRCFLCIFAAKRTRMSDQTLPYTVYSEMTPNPAVLKFVANKLLVEGNQILEFKNIEEAKPSPLASRLFHFPFVKEVFITENYVSVTKFDIVDWDEITLEIREFIRDFLQSGKSVLLAPVNNATSSATAAELAQPVEPTREIDKKIVEILDTYVKPAVQQDGGNIKFRKYEDGQVHVILQGACNGCPSSMITLRNGIENMLKQMLPGEVNEVVAENA